MIVTGDMQSVVNYFLFFYIMALFREKINKIL